jgi:hypothetical protein
MSWFNRAPRPKNPPHSPAPKHFSPVAEQVLNETKQQVRGERTKKKTNKK